MVLEQQDPDINSVLESEKTRQRENINLIASENYVVSPKSLKSI